MERPKENPQRVRTRYTRYAKEFKLEAVRLFQLGQKPPTESALERGIRRNQHYKWSEELTRKRGDETAFDGPRGRPSADRLSEVDRLKRELKKVTEERDIPNKANSFF